MSDQTPPPEDIPSRGVKIQRIDEEVRCVMGHRVGSQHIGVLGHAWVRCTRRAEIDEGSSTMCGEVIYVVNFGNGTRGVVRVDWREAARIEKLQMSIDDVAHFLHLPWRSGMP